MIDFITPAIRYIGCDDADLPLFESQYETPAGMCYNSYVLFDDKTVLFDTVDPRCGAEWLAKVEDALQGRTPDYLILHHLEPDHSGSIESVLERYPSLRVVCSAQAAKYLPQFFEHFDTTRIQVVKEGDTLHTGHHTLQFIQATFVHWPEVIMTFCPEAGILFSADGFGKFGVYDADADDWACEARRYYFNICGKYGTQVQALLKKAAALDIQTICPLHGPILKENLSYYIGLYDTWSKYGVETEGVFVAYASIHGGTAEAAQKLAEILKVKGAPKVAISDLSRDDMAEAIEDAFRYGKLIVAAPTYDAGIFPPMHDFLHHLQIKAYQKRKVGIIENGSWAPTAGKLMAAMLEQMKEVEIVQPVVTIKSRMKEANIAELEALADAILK